jgi:hypothetical protein
MGEEEMGVALVPAVKCAMQVACYLNLSDPGTASILALLDSRPRNIGSRGI